MSSRKRKMKGGTEYQFVDVVYDFKNPNKAIEEEEKRRYGLVTGYLPRQNPNEKHSINNDAFLKSVLESHVTQKKVERAQKRPKRSLRDLRLKDFLPDDLKKKLIQKGLVSAMTGKNIKKELARVAINGIAAQAIKTFKGFQQGRGRKVKRSYRF